MRLRLALAATLDRLSPRAHRLLEKWGWPQPWLQEFQGFLAEPRMTPEEFWVRYTLKRLAAQDALAAVTDERSALAFYRTHDYMLWRNVVHRRHAAWRRVRVTMPKRAGRLLEFGCATAPVSTWVSRERRAWEYTLVDVPSPHRDYGLWRMRQARRIAHAYDTLPTHGGTWDVITALDVMEHLADPLPVARALVSRLSRGGYLHWNFVGNPRRNDLDLATEEQERETVTFLYKSLRVVWENDGYRVSQR